MRIFPIITAILVMVVLYFVVLERDSLVSWATGGEEAEVAAAAEDTETPAAPTDDNAADGIKRVHVIARASTASAVPNAVLLRGETQAARQVEARAQTSGIIISDPLRKGAQITEGQLLCELDPGTRRATLAEAEARLVEARARVPETEARVAEARARLQEAQINQNAAARLSEGGFASETRVANADAALSSAQAAVTSAETGLESVKAGILSAEAGVQRALDELDNLKITAPFDGLLESDTAELGTLLQPGALCATVIQLDPIKLVGFVPETEVGKVTVGANAGARLASGERVTGQVTFLARSADATTRTFRVEVQVPNPDLAIRDGQTAEILIESDSQRAHLLPASALTLNGDGKIGVRIVDADSVAQFLPITLLRDTMDGVLVTGLPEAVDVILVGQEYVTEGVPVQVTYGELSQ